MIHDPWSKDLIFKVQLYDKEIILQLYIFLFLWSNVNCKKLTSFMLHLCKYHFYFKIRCRILQHTHCFSLPIRLRPTKSIPLLNCCLRYLIFSTFTSFKKVSWISPDFAGLTLCSQFLITRQKLKMNVYAINRSEKQINSDISTNNCFS